MVVTKRKILRLEERSCVYVTADRTYPEGSKSKYENIFLEMSWILENIFLVIMFFYDLLDEFHGPYSHGGESNDRIKILPHLIPTTWVQWDACDSRDCGGLSSSLLFVVLRI